MGANNTKVENTGRALIEPDDGIEVQVVSGLIQHQQRGFHEQCPKEEWRARSADLEPLAGRT